MTGRDRMVLIGVIVLVALGAGWILVVSPERQKASKLDAQVTTAKSELASAEEQLAHARTAQSQYAAAYSSVVSLGKAVPPGQEVPSLIVQLARATGQRDVEFSSITSGGGASASASATSTTTPSTAGSTSSASSPAAGASATFTQMPFTFVFNGGFFNLERLFHRLDGFAATTSSGGVHVSGRLLTIQSIKLAPIGSEVASGKSGQLSGTISATAYELPAGQGLTGSASGAPAGATPAAAATPSSAPTAPAVVQVHP